MCKPRPKMVALSWRYFEVSDCRTPVPERSTEFPGAGGVERTMNWYRKEVLPMTIHRVMRPLLP